MRAASLNHVYRLVWNSVTHSWVVVSEITKSKGKSKSQKAALILASAMLAGFAGVALAGPEGGVVTGGSGTIDYSGNTTTINQSSQNLYLNWNSFNVAAHETVNFVQPNATALAVNQILDTNGSRILGNINANGQVWLINPNGVYFGQGAQINVGSLLASTLNPLGNTTTNCTQVFGNGGTGSVTNEGRITAANEGYVALIGNTVSNTGSIVANNGAVALGAGSRVSVTFADNQLLSLTVDQSTLNNLAENKGLIQANGGIALLSAGAKDSLLASVVNHEGVIEAKTVDHKEGKIILMGGMAAGTTKVAGALDASAQTGNGGFIETSAAHVKVADSAKVTTHAANGKTGTWLIDPVDFTVAASGGDMTGAAVNNALALNVFTIQSTLGANGVNGDININDAISWSTNNTLTLNAQRNININSTITATGATGKLALEYGQGSSNGVINGVTADYKLNAPISLKAGNNFSTKLGSNGSTTNYNVITDVGTLQNINDRLAGNYVLGSNIDASATTGWNSGAGFKSLGNDSTKFTGRFDGLGHYISNLYINRPREDNVGLFGYTSAANIRNVGLVNANIIGSSNVGALIGYASNNTNVNAVFSTGSVQGRYYIGYVYSGEEYGWGNAPVGGNNIGGLVGVNNQSTIMNAYSSASVYSNGIDSIYSLSGSDLGGLVGQNSGGIVANSYATGDVTTANDGSGDFDPVIGSLVGRNNGTVNNSFSGVSAQTKAYTTFSNAGWNISSDGVENTVWRIYEGNTTPLLRAFLTPLQVTPDFDGTQTTINNINSYSVQGAYDASKLLGGGGLTLSSPSAGNYWASTAHYSSQIGYDIKGRAISTPESQKGEIVLNNGVQWTNGTLNINGNVTNPGAIVSSNGIFNLVGGTWKQVGANNAAFSVKDFRVGDGAFIRALAGDGSASKPYQLFDVYGLQGVGSNTNTLGLSYSLANKIDAIEVKNWNSGQGFEPIGDESKKFTGSVDGQDNIITNLTINRPTENNVGLFGVTDAAIIKNIGLVDAFVKGKNNVGILVGYASNNSYISNAFTTGAVYGKLNTYFDDIWGEDFIGDAASIGGMVGVNDKSTINNAYTIANTSVDSSAINFRVLYSNDEYRGQNIGGLVGYNNQGNIRNTYTTSSIIGGGSTTNLSANFTANLKSLTTFKNAGWSISDVGGESTVWRIYDGQTTPLLRSFLTQVELGTVSTVASYNGRQQTLAIDLSKLDSTKVFGEHAKGTNAGIYTSRYFSDQLGYDFIGDTSLVINKADATVIANSKSVTYNGATQTVTGFKATGLVNNEDESVLTDLVKVGGSGRNAGEYQHTYTGADKNYNLTFVAGNLSIDKKAITLTPTAVSKTYDGLTSYSAQTNDLSNLTGQLLAGSGDSVTAATLLFANKDAGLNKAVALDSVTINDGNNGNNYAITKAANSTGTINKANLSVVTNDFVSSGAASIAINSANGLVQNEHVTGVDVSGGGFNLLFGDGVLASNYNLTSVQVVGNAGADLNVNRGFNWGDINLTFKADKNININQETTVGGKFALEYGQGAVASGNSATYNANARVNLQAGDNFSTKLGSNGSVTQYKVITSLGSATSSNDGSLQGIDGNRSGNYVLGADIDASATSSWNDGAGFKPLGAVISINDLNGFFTGNFDGLNHTISNLSINRPSSSQVGLFGLSTGNIRNIGMVGGSIIGGNSDVGSLVGRNDGSITNAFATSSVNGVVNVGGLVGRNYGSITNTYATGAVTATNWAGGLVGQNVRNNSSATITNSYATGKLTVKQTAAGGLVGINSSGTIVNSYWDTQASSLNTSAGGSGKTTAEMQQLSTFSGWDIDAQGGTSKVWRIYEGQTGPMLRSFMTQSNLGTVTKHYTGQVQDASSAVAGLDSAHVFGTAASGINAGTYQTAYYSDQLGYDFSGGDLIIDPTRLNILNVGGTRVYDGTVLFNAGVLTLDGLMNGETLNLSGYGTVADKNVGVNKALDVSHLNLGNSSGLASNYTFDGGTHQVTITAKNLTVNADAANKTYDGNNSATVTLSTADMVTGDKLNLNKASATFSDKHAADNKTVTVNGISLSGDDAGNYALQSATATDTANITQATLTLKAVSDSKVYDGNDSSNKAVGVVGLQGDDQVTVSQVFADKNVKGTNGSTLQINAGYTINDGNDGNNYIVQTSTALGSINPKALTITGTTAADKTYDGKATATASAGTLQGFVGNESINVSVANANFADRNAGQDKAVTVSYALADGDNGGLSSNYTLANSVVFADINKAILTYVANAASSTSANMAAGRTPTLMGTVTGFVEGDSLANATTGRLTWSLSGKPRFAGKYAITGSGLSSDNYDFVQAVTNSTAFTIKVK